MSQKNETMKPDTPDLMPEVKITERGYAGHFICSSRCLFRRNTLIEAGDKKIVVSTVGNMLMDNGKRETIGLNRHYETMAFEAVFEAGYWEADVGRQLSFESEWAISELKNESDDKADKMHDAAVQEFVTNFRSDLADRRVTPEQGEEPSDTHFATSAELFQALGTPKDEAEKQGREINAIVRRGEIKAVEPTRPAVEEEIPGLEEAFDVQKWIKEKNLNDDCQYAKNFYHTHKKSYRDVILEAARRYAALQMKER